MSHQRHALTCCGSQVDDNTIVYVADPTFKNSINVNVGRNVDLEVPRVSDILWLHLI